MMMIKILIIVELILKLINNHNIDETYTVHYFHEVIYLCQEKLCQQLNHSLMETYKVHQCQLYCKQWSIYNKINEIIIRLQYKESQGTI